MILREDMAIRGSPAQVWSILSDPSLMELWNPKCVKCESRHSPVSLGTRYKATFRFSGRPAHECWCEVVDYAPLQRVRTRFSGEVFRNGGYVDEEFRLIPLAAATRLMHLVDYTHSGLPWIIAVLMRFIQTFGYSVGKSPLEGIKELAENHGQAMCQRQ